MVWDPNVVLSNGHRYKVTWRAPAASKSVTPNRIRATPPQMNRHESGPHTISFQIGLDAGAESEREAELETTCQYPKEELSHLGLTSLLRPDSTYTR